MKRKIQFAVLVGLVVSVVFVSVVFFELPKTGDQFSDDFFVGVTADGNVTATKALIDRVEGLTNLVIFNNPDVIRDEASLDEVCSYARRAGQSFFVFMAHPAFWQYNYNPVSGR